MTIPQEWIKVSLKELGLFGDLKNGFAFKSSDYQKFGIPLIKIGNFNQCQLNFSNADYLPENFINEYSNFLVYEDDLIIAMSGATTGKIAVVKKSDLPAFLNQRVGNLGRLNRKLIFEPYLPYLEIQLKKELITLAPGSAMPNISKPMIEQLHIYLPPLEEQRRIVARVEEVMGKIEEVRSLRQKALDETEAFVTSLHLSLADSKIVTLDEILTLDEQQEQVLFGKQYFQVGVKGFGGGLFAKEAIDATQTTYKAFNCLYEGALVLSQVKGWEGAIGVCPSYLVGKYVSPEYRTFRCIPGKAIPEYLSALVATPWFWTKLKDLNRGMGGRRERTRPEQFLKMKIPMPTVEYQQKAIYFFNKIHKMKPVRVEAIKELDALLPSILDKAFKGEL
ncbi:restriction endonuclease subunit S [Nostoc sp.]|uniref:restriction endonuclease subunit S n=1 Tax=Nostoc sp. TaxID=1180 RepID=UPI002FF4F7B3